MLEPTNPNYFVWESPSGVIWEYRHVVPGPPGNEPEYTESRHLANHMADGSIKLILGEWSRMDDEPPAPVMEFFFGPVVKDIEPIVKVEENGNVVTKFFTVNDESKLVMYHDEISPVIIPSWYNEKADGGFGPWPDRGSIIIEDEVGNKMFYLTFVNGENENVELHVTPEGGETEIIVWEV